MAGEAAGAGTQALELQHFPRSAALAVAGVIHRLEQ
jgi:hypothetical protein